jgi:hypothetical protein
MGWGRPNRLAERAWQRLWGGNFSGHELRTEYTMHMTWSAIGSG